MADSQTFDKKERSFFFGILDLTPPLWAENFIKGRFHER
jgi:hypothetical protein